MQKQPKPDLIYTKGGLFNESGFVLLCPRTCEQMCKVWEISTWGDYANFAFGSWTEMVDEFDRDGTFEDGVPAPNDSINLFEFLGESIYGLVPNAMLAAADVLSSLGVQIETEGVHWSPGMDTIVVTASSEEAVRALEFELDSKGHHVVIARDDELAKAAYGPIV